MSPPDVRAFYTALGIQLPGWPKLEAPIRCFAQPDVHNHGDRSPSCSVNLASGAWNCHGCGAHGGAYDAALAIGNTPRSAIDLMITHGLAEPRAHHGHHSKAKPPAPPTRPVPAAADRRQLALDEVDVQSWADALGADSCLARRLILERGWAPRTMRALEIGFDGARLTIPIRNEHGHLRGLLRYDAFGRRQPKMRAAPGSRLGLIPHPAIEHSNHLFLVEGPPDMIAARSSGLAAIAVPGTSAWQQAWAPLFAGRHLTIVMDCDGPGRRAARVIASDVKKTATAVELVDLWPSRDDGYDFTDWILACRRSWSCASPVRTTGFLLRENRESARHE